MLHIIYIIVIKISFVEDYFLVFEKVQNCPFYAGAQFIEPRFTHRGFDESNPLGIPSKGNS